jgi:hypothetical protein
MGKRQLKSDDVDGFMLAFWDEVMDTAKLYNVTVLVDVRIGLQRGRVTFHACALDNGDNGYEGPVAASEVHWPTHKATSVHALLYSLACKLNIEVQRWHRERTGRYYSTPT